MNANTALLIIVICVIVQTVMSFRSFAFTKASLQKLGNPRGNNPDIDAIKKAMADGQYDEALKMALSLREKNSRDVNSWYYSGLCYYNMKNWDKAEAELKEAQMINPTWEEKWTGPYLRAIAEQKNKGGK